MLGIGMKSTRSEPGAYKSYYAMRVDAFPDSIGYCKSHESLFDVIDDLTIIDNTQVHPNLSINGERRESNGAVRISRIQT